MSKRSNLASAVEVIDTLEPDFLSPFKRLKVRTSTPKCSPNNGRKLKSRKAETDENADPNYGRCEKISEKISCLVAGKGQLKLAIYVNYGLLTVHIIQGRHLKSRWKVLSDSYVKISLVPDHDRRSRCKTNVVADTNNPLYDDKFSFELLDEDKKKRLLVSVWHKDAKNGRSEFLGCMSFGVKNLLQPTRPVNGWYYLLTEETGRRKHLPAPTGKPVFGLQHKSHKNIPEVNSDVLWMDSKTISIQKRKSGYGFTLTGASPAYISKIEKDSPADEAGLQIGDFIVRINGQNVSRSTSESIGRIIRYERHCQQKITLDIQRKKPEDRHTMQVDDKDVIDLSLLPSPTNCNGRTSESPGPDHQTTPLSARSTTKSSPTSSVEGTSDVEVKNINNCGANPRPRGQGVRTTTPPLSIAYQELHDRDVFRQQAISRLLDFEETYVKNMQIAIQRYCRPLKKGAIISSSEYASLFQNVEKLLTISEYYVRQLKLNSLPYIDTDRQGEGFIDAVGFIYMAKLQLMCEMYGIYCAHLDKGKTALYSLVAKVEFRKFLEEAIQTDPSIVLGIEDFICKPYQHIWQVLIHLQSIQVYTATDHHDYPFLEEVVLELHRCCNSANSYRPHTIQYSPPSSHSTMVSRSTTSSSLSTVSSGDSEMVQLRNKTIFAKHVKEIPLCVPNRHLIYAGKLNQVTTIQKTRQTWVMLFSDIILITDKQENVTVVIEDPIYIHDLVHQDYDRSNVNEFQLICRLTGISYQSIVLEAPSVEQKHTWKTLLQQRIDNLRDNDNSSLKHQSSLRSLIV